MSGYAVYPEYRDSVEWIGQIPSDWCRSYLGFECSVKARLGWKGLKADEYVEDGYIFLATPNIKDSEIDFHNVNYITEERFLESPEIMLSEGDVLVTKDGSTTGTTNVVRSLPKAATVNSSIAVLRPSGTVVSEYLYYFFRSEYTQNIIERVRGGMGVPHLFQADLRKFLLLLPPKKQQQKIANFLDHETAKIDTLIEKQQQLIKLLKEKRQAVISHAVTKGLNPDAPMKDSGVEWLGEVPEHWEVLKLKYFAQMQGGFAFSSEEFKTDGVQLLRIGNVYLNRLALHRQPVFVDSSLIDSYQDYVVNSGDILMSLTGTLGKTDYGYAVSVEEDGPFLLNQRLARITPANGTMDRGFLLFTIRSTAYLNQLYSLPSGTKQANLSNDDVLGITIAAPSCREEQRRIASYIGDVLRRVNTLVSRAESAIELSRERRTALISAAVTGKIDVRNWQPPADTSTPSMDA